MQEEQAFARTPICESRELRYCRFSVFLEVFWASDAHFNSNKADIWQLYVGYVYLTYKKSSIKKYYILGILEPYLDQNKGPRPYMGIRFLPISRSILVQSRKFLYRDAQGMIIYKIGYILGGLVARLNLRPVAAHIWARPSRGARNTQRLQIFAKSSPYGWGFLVNPYLQIEFSQKFWVNPPPLNDSFRKDLAGVV